MERWSSSCTVGADGAKEHVIRFKGKLYESVKYRCFGKAENNKEEKTLQIHVAGKSFHGCPRV